MTERTRKLLEEVLALPTEKQAEILDQHSALSRAHHGLGSADIAAEWDAEIARRLDEVDSGKVKTITLEEFWKRLRDGQAEHDV